MTKSSKKIIKCIGLPACYLYCIIGHRKDVQPVLQVDEVLYCDRINDEYIMNAKYHKTPSTYGRTKLALTKEEYLELEHFNRLRTALPGFN